MTTNDELITEEKLSIKEIVNFAVSNTKLPDANKRILKSSLIGFITALIEQEKEDYLKYKLSYITDEMINDEYKNKPYASYWRSGIKWVINKLNE